MIDKLLVQKHFNKHAKEYDQFAVVQKRMADQLINELTDMYVVRGNSAEPDLSLRVLEIGCGTGYLTKRLLKSFSQIRITSLDLSESMLQQTRQNCAAFSDMIELFHADVEEWVDRRKYGSTNEAAGTYDIIVSNATFQWLNHPQDTMRGLTYLLKDNGCLAFSTFGEGTFHELHTAFQRAESQLELPVQRHGQVFLGKRAWRRCLTQSGLSPRPRPWSHPMTVKQESHVIFYSSVREFLQHVKRVGAGNALQQKQAHFPGKRLFEAMYQSYAAEFEEDRGFPATYEVEYYVYTK